MILVSQYGHISEIFGRLPCPSPDISWVPDQECRSDCPDTDGEIFVSHVQGRTRIAFWVVGAAKRQAKILLAYCLLPGAESSRHRPFAASGHTWNFF